MDIDYSIDNLKNELLANKLNKILKEVRSFDDSDAGTLLSEMGYDREDVVDYIEKSDEYFNKHSKLPRLALDSEKAAALDATRYKLTKLFITKDKKALIILGLPGSGKSTALAEIESYYNKKFYLIDSDEYKIGIKDDQGNFLAEPLCKKELKGIDLEYIHEASSEIARLIFLQVTDVGYNVALPKVGDNYIKLKSTINDLKKKGYEVDIHFIYTTVETALKRNLDRFTDAMNKNENIRLVPPKLIIDFGYKPLYNFLVLIQNKVCDQYSLWDGEHYKKPKRLTL